jgi:uncharacterized SAM-binding protein YcdF (DUF218 family)
LTRLIEGILLFKATNAENLILTGSDFLSDISIAMTMKQCAVELGVDEHKIITVDNARNTREEAKYTADFARGDTVFLVSSAAHLKRAVKNFEKEGIFCVPVPTDYQTQPGKIKMISDYFPGPQRIENCSKSIHEYFGLLWEVFRK